MMKAESGIINQISLRKSGLKEMLDRAEFTPLQKLELFAVTKSVALELGGASIKYPLPMQVAQDLRNRTLDCSYSMREIGTRLGEMVIRFGSVGGQLEEGPTPAYSLAQYE